MNGDIVKCLEEIDATLQPFGGRFAIHGGEVEVLEGEWSGHVVMLAFPDLTRARDWYRSAAYQAIVRFRTNNSRADLVLVEGVGSDHRATDILVPTR